MTSWPFPLGKAKRIYANLKTHPEKSGDARTGRDPLLATPLFLLNQLTLTIDFVLFCLVQVSPVSIDLVCVARLV